MNLNDNKDREKPCHHGDKIANLAKELDLEHEWADWHTGLTVLIIFYIIVTTNMLSLGAIILIPLFTIVFAICGFLFSTIISYIRQKPEPNKSTFDIASLNLAWYRFIWSLKTKMKTTKRKLLHFHWLCKFYSPFWWILLTKLRILQKLNVH